MAGSLNNNVSALKKWYDLFTFNQVNRSLHAQKHWNYLIKTGLPDNKDENWKYTPLTNFLSQQFVFPKKTKFSIDKINQLTLQLNASRLVFVNGYFELSLSSYDNSIFEINNKTISEDLKLPEPIHPEIFLHLTESLAEQINIIRVSSNKVSSTPLYLLHINDGQKDGLNTVHYRNHLILEKNTKIEVIEHFLTLNSNAHFTGSRLTFNISDHANLQHTKLAFENNKSYHFSHNDMIIGDNAQVVSNTFLIGTKISRHNNSIKLNGKHSELIINSLSVPTNQEIADIRIYLEHNKSDCKSRQIHKAIVLDKSCAVFNGHIKVAPSALKTDGNMINNNLLLCDQAQVNTKPQLEIYADDVKCSHGVTIGCIDNEQIFYLTSRGIKKKDAQLMLVNAFAVELIEALDNNVVKQDILNHINKRISRGNM
ncbi:Fe-S cluster assembly protein SufD [Candidatus Pantoea edessiphila]|uniref:FeS cluster assembly protein SufD n=1 Tax=Candidatus Pantoea edessiphila TaxID=2044610 RepID=A0A2P5SWW4_9GAMM|nr:Fe-S cluster assembly protein SufD [Candidatus Pantoea edessiphila]PPI86803.1 FeS cluster assembly protein SufD [Candidatus Pantoea edessiphila]